MKIFKSLVSFLLLVSSVMAQQPLQGPPPSPAERLKHITGRLEKDLVLNADQKEKVGEAYKSFFIGMDKLMGKPEGPPQPPPPNKKPEVDKLVKARDEVVKKALTNEQYKKYVEIEKTMRPRGPGGTPGDRPAPPPR